MGQPLYHSLLSYTIIRKLTAAEGILALRVLRKHFCLKTTTSTLYYAQNKHSISSQVCSSSSELACAHITTSASLGMLLCYGKKLSQNKRTRERGGVAAAADSTMFNSYWYKIQKHSPNKPRDHHRTTTQQQRRTNVGAPVITTAVSASKTVWITTERLSSVRRVLKPSDTSLDHPKVSSVFLKQNWSVNFQKGPCGLYELCSFYRHGV